MILANQNSLIRRTTRVAISLGAGVLMLIGPGTASARQPRGLSGWFTYDAALGTLPEAQCWTAAGAAPIAPEVVGGALHISTLPSTSQGTGDNSFPYWERADVAIDFLQGFVMETEARVIGSDLRFTPTTMYPRAGYTPLYAVDRLGRFVHVGITSTSVFLANSHLIPLGSPGCPSIPFNPTDGYHAYRLDITGAGATLSIDGTPRLTVPLGPTGLAGRLVLFGDATGWANCDVLIRSARFATGVPPCPGDTNGDGVANLADIAVLIGNWGRTTPPACSTADIDGSGSIGLGDIAAVVQNWSAACP